MLMTRAYPLGPISQDNVHLQAHETHVEHPFLVERTQTDAMELLLALQRDVQHHGDTARALRAAHGGFRPVQLHSHGEIDAMAWAQYRVRGKATDRAGCLHLYVCG